MINKIQILIICLLIPFGTLYWYTSSNQISIREIFFPGVAVMHIGEIPLRVEIAQTDAERITGLSGRDALTSVDGMLFVFEESGYHTIWMKDMNFPIDIIWIDEELVVIDIEKNVYPDTYPKIFRPSRPARYIVETNTLFSDTFGLREGHSVRLPQSILKDN